MEYLPCGDLLGFLRKSRGIVDKYYRGEGEVANLKTYDLVSFSNQIATGMVFLASRGVATETKFLYPLLFAQSIVSNVLKIMVNFIFVKS